MSEYKEIIVRVPIEDLEFKILEDEGITVNKGDEVVTQYDVEEKTVEVTLVRFPVRGVVGCDLKGTT